MSEHKIEREGLKPHVGKRIEISGNFRKFDTWDDYRTHRQYARASLQDVFAGDTLIADHVWVHHAEPLRCLEPELDIDETVTLQAIVKEYKKRELDQLTGKTITVTSYFMDRPENVVLPGRKVVAHRNGETDMRIIPTIPPPRPPQLAWAELHTKPSNLPKEHMVLPPLEYYQIIKDCKALAKRCGGMSELCRLVQLMLEE